MPQNDRPELYILDTDAMREMMAELGGKACHLKPLSRPRAVWVNEIPVRIEDREQVAA